MIQKEYLIKSCDHSCSPFCYTKQSNPDSLEFSLPQVPFYFIRHGETEWNQKKLIQGCTDISLHDKGIAQAYQAAHMLKEVPVATIISSPLQRALTTAEIIAKSLGKPVTVIDEFKNACYGMIEGKSKAEHHEAYAGWKTGYPVEGAECYPCFMQRVYRGLNKALQYPGPVLIVAHGGIHWPVQELLNLGAYTIPNAIPIAHLPPAQQNNSWTVRAIQ